MIKSVLPAFCRNNPLVPFIGIAKMNVNIIENIMASVKNVIDNNKGIMLYIYNVIGLRFD